ncbi:MAG TPA: hypothetical protein VEK79_02660 [Thermoanaerobaculia bacterium]|nr:hypothetical protein [Thermoanaerobaculia bacterium]
MIFTAGVQAATYTVNTANGGPAAVDGVCSLREAINIANLNAGVAIANDCFTGTTTSPPHTIQFNIAPAGQHTITLSSNLSITQPMLIDGTTQPGYPAGGCASFAVPQIVINAQSMTANSNGVIHLGFPPGVNDVTVRGLTIQNMPANTPALAILGNGSTGGLRNVIECNFLGVNSAGTAAAPIAANQRLGIEVRQGSDNIIRNNLISGFSVPGSAFAIEVASSAGSVSSRNLISGNRIGTDLTGAVAIANRGGVSFRTSSGNPLDRGDQNLVIGNLLGSNLSGIVVGGATNTRIQSNKIGTNLAGTAALNSGGVAVQVDSSGAATIIGTDGNGLNDAAEGNLLSGNTTGISLSGSGTKVSGNLIGTDATGNAALGNAAGIVISNNSNDNVIGTDGDGQADAVERNVIVASSNNGSRVGVAVQGRRTRVSGNYIGVGANGTVALPNDIGVRINCLFAAPLADGTIVGTDGDGIADAQERNIISGNSTGTGAGVELAGTSPCVGQRIAGNYIGLNANGTAALPNKIGVLLQGSGTSNYVGTNGDGNGDAAERNIISGNTTIGVSIAETSGDHTGNYVAGNWIGLDATGGAVIANASGVIVADGSDVGATDAANVIGDNVIVGQSAVGIRLSQSGVQEQLIGNNYIGTNATFSLFSPNARGIYVVGGQARVAGNRVYRNNTGIEVASNATFTASTGNCIAGNLIGANHTFSPGPSPDFTNNWWGAASGPNEPVTNPGGTGDTVIKSVTSTGITVVPFLNAPPSYCHALQPSIGKSFLDPSIALNATTTLTVTIGNPSAVIATGVSFTDTLPAGVQVASSPTQAGCGVAPSGAVGGSTFGLSGGTIAAGGTCTIQVLVQGTSVGTKTNQITDFASTPAPASATSNQATVTVVDGLTISKSFTNDPVAAGSNVTLQFQVSNLAANAAHGIGFSDDLAAVMPGLTAIGVPLSNVCGAGSQLSAVGSTLVLTDGTLPAGGTCSFSVTLQTPVSATPGGYPNTTSMVTGSVLSVPVSGTPATDTLVIGAAVTADLSMDKSVNNAAPVAGTNVVFTLTVSNAGADAATGVTVRDLLPAGLTHVSDDGGGSYVPGTGFWTIGSIANGGSASLQITALVSGTGVITNYAQVTASNELDPDSTPNDHSMVDDDDDTQSITVTPAADLSLDLSVNNATPSYTSTVVFTILVTNSGPNTATGVVVKDLLPPGLTYIADTGFGAYVPGTGIWTVGSLASGASTSLNIHASASATGTISNYAQVMASGTFDPDSVPNDDSITQDDDDSRDITVPATADLSLGKFLSNNSPAFGATVVFTLTVSNTGPDPATGVTVKDLLPAGVTYVSDDSGGSYAPGTGIWTVGSAPVGSSVSLQITVTVSATGAISNYAEVNGSDMADPDSTPGNSSLTEDDDAQQAMTVPPAADLSLNKTVDNASPVFGSTVTFTIVVSNAGPDTAPSVVVQDLITGSGGLTYASDDGNGAYIPASGNWTVGSLGSGASASLTITATVTGTGTIGNYTQVTSAGVADPDSTPNDISTDEDDDDLEFITVGANADLFLDKSVNNTTPALGENVVFTLTVANGGPDAATGVTVQDVLPPGLVYVSHNGGTYAPGTGIWTVGSLLNGTSSTLLITAATTATGTITNYAQVAASDVPDVDSTPNDNSVADDDDDTQDVIVPPASDLSLDKSVDDDTPLLGSNVVFTITVTNDGPDTATGITVADLLPAGLIYVSDDGGGAYVPGTGLWTVGTIAGGSSSSLQITATVNALGTLSNYAQVVGSALYDPDSTPNDDSVTQDDDDTQILTVISADLSLGKSVNDATPPLGSNVVFTITVSNAGPDTATDVVVQDQLPGGLTYVSDNGGGAYVPGTGLWAAGSLASGAAKSLQITVNAAMPGTHSNYAQIVATSASDPDSIPGNGSTTEDDDAVQDVVVVAADLSLGKGVDDTTPALGSNVVFTLTVSNAGPHMATGVVVRDQLPVGLTYIGDNGAGSYVPAGGNWTVGSLASGASASLQITAIVSGTGMISNYAQIAASSAPDPDSTVNDDSTSQDDDDRQDIIVAGTPTADVEIAKFLTTGGVYSVGQSVHYELVVTNNGPATATAIQITDVPTNLTITSVSGGGCSALPCTIGILGLNASSTIDLVATIDADGFFDNSASVSAAEPDPVPENNTDDQNNSGVTGIPVDLYVLKTLDTPGPYVAGQTIQYTLVAGTLDNAGTNVQITDVPANLTITQVSSSACPALPCTIANLAPGVPVGIVLQARIDAPGAFSNAAGVSADQNDPNPSNNTDAGNGGTADARADLTMVKTLTTAGPYTAGQTVSYTLVISNGGPSTATSLQVTDNPLNLSGPTSASGDCLAIPCTIPSLASGATATIDLTFTVANPGLFRNTASVFAAEPDPFITDNTATTVESTHAGPLADIHIGKTLDTQAPFHPGQTIQYTLVVTNLGPTIIGVTPTAATNVQIVDTPTNLTIVEVTGACSTLPCTIPSIPPQTALTIVVRATVNATGAFDNIVTVTAAETDPNAANNADTTGNGGLAGSAASAEDIPTAGEFGLLLLSITLALAGMYVIRAR